LLFNQHIPIFIIGEIREPYWLMSGTGFIFKESDYANYNARNLS
jgi:hypothetical protein